MGANRSSQVFVANLPDVSELQMRSSIPTLMKRRSTPSYCNELCRIFPEHMLPRLKESVRKKRTVYASSVVRAACSLGPFYQARAGSRELSTRGIPRQRAADLWGEKARACVPLAARKIARTESARPAGSQAPAAQKSNAAEGPLAAPLARPSNSGCRTPCTTSARP